MIKRALLPAASILGFYFSLAAQQTSQTGELRNHIATPEQSRDVVVFDPAFGLSLYSPGIIDASAGSALLLDRPMLTLLDGDDLLAEMGVAPLDLFPIASSDVSAEQTGSATPVHRSARNNAGADGKNSPTKEVISPLSPLYYTGELGVFYGRSSGKFEREIMETYFLGQIGNDKFQITVGGAYGESNGSLPRFHSVAPRK
jgi:hypothetical protein